MSPRQRTPCIVSAAEHAGWADLVCVAAPGNVPAVIDRRRVPLIGAGVPTMPYHHESLSLPVDKADALIGRVRRSIAGSASRALRRLVNDLAPHYSVVALAIREATFPALPESVASVRQSYQLQCAADGMMYQLALCHAARQLKLRVHQCPRGEEMSWAAEQLGVPPGELDEFVSRKGRPPGPPWAQEHRRAYATGIAALTTHASGRLRI